MVIAFGYSDTELENEDEEATLTQSDFTEGSEHYQSNKLQEYVFLGFMTFSVDIRPEAQFSIRSMQNGGVIPKLVTTASENLARHIATTSQLADNDVSVFLKGDQVKEMFGPILKSDDDCSTDTSPLSKAHKQLNDQQKFDKVNRKIDVISEAKLRDKKSLVIGY